MPGIIEPEGAPDPQDAPLPLHRRLAWFAGLALCGAGLTAAVAYALRALLHIG
jgi:hypothetical protein